MSPRVTTCLVAVLAYASAACTTTDVLAPGARMALAQSTSADLVRLPTTNGGSVDFGPNATLTITGGAGGTTEVAAANLYTNDEGLFKKSGELITTWDDLRTVKIEQLDGAATVAVTATVAIAAVAIAFLLKSAPSSGSSKSSSSASSPTPRAPRSAVVRMPSSGPPSAPDPAVTEVLFRTAEALTSAPASNGGVTVGVDPDPEDEPSTAMPLFSRGARRRANVRVLARLEGGVCWPGGGSSGDCVVSGARAGLRILDLLEVGGGLRVESDATRSQPLAVFGAMLHGESPSAHWFALAIGASVAFDGTRAHIVPEVAVRFQPMRGLWLGLVPLEPVYRSEDGSWSMASGVEVTGEL